MPTLLYTANVYPARCLNLVVRSDFHHSIINLKIFQRCLKQLATILRDPLLILRYIFVSALEGPTLGRCLLHLLQIVELQIND